MARINIEDSLFRDSRWLDLIIKTGCQHRALGLLARAWILAQEHWLEYGHVPAKAWLKDLNILIDVELAKRLSDGNVYVKGSKTAFGWLEQRVAAGRKGGLTKRVQGEATAKRPLDPAKHTLDPAKPLTLSPPLTLTQIIKNKTKEEKPAQAPSPPIGSDLSVSPTNLEFSDSKKPTGKAVATFIAAYCDAYRERYGARPEIVGKDTGIVNRLLRAVGPLRATQIVQAYLQMGDRWFLTKAHDLATLEANLTKVSTALQTGFEDPAKEQAWNKTVKEFNSMTQEDTDGTDVVYGADEAPGGGLR